MHTTSTKIARLGNKVLPDDSVIAKPASTQPINAQEHNMHQAQLIHSHLTTTWLAAVITSVIVTSAKT
jgi:hypothetical protein